MPGCSRASLAIATVLSLIVASAGPSSGGVTVGTLTILAEPVLYRAAGTPTGQPGRPGMNLAEGDTVQTGPAGFALITFLDGSTVTVEPASEVVVKQAQLRHDESRMGLLILAGKVWARVAELVGRQSSLSLESNANSATARDGLIGAEARTDGTFTCWSRRGEVIVRDAAGATLDVVKAGEKLTLAPRKAPRLEPFRVHESTLEVVASPNVLPLLQMPDRQRVAGWTAAGVEVNQVFGSRTASTPDGRSVEVPSGRPGPYAITLVGRGGGSFTLAIVGRFQGRVVYQRRVAGTIESGGQRHTTVHPHFKEEPGGDATSARVMGATIEPVRGQPRPGEPVTRSR